MTTHQRDFIGYGPNPPAVRWPGGARIAISVNIFTGTPTRWPTATA